MKNVYIVFLYVLFMLCGRLFAQERNPFRYDTIQVEQEWKKIITGKKDTSYLKVCIPNNDVKPAYDCNYDNFVIICDDGAVIRFLSTPTIPSSIYQHLKERYGDTINQDLGNNVLKLLQREWSNVHLLDLTPDSSLYYPEPKTWEGVSNEGLYWKLKRIEFFCISYENVTQERKKFYDYVLSKYRILKDNEVVNYRYLPLYENTY